MNKQQQSGIGALLVLTLVVILICVPNALAIVSGATVTNVSTDFGPTRSPQSLSNARGTISTITLDALQQNSRWKAYVGNVTGTLTLDDANNNSIYQWPTGSSVSGEVYASRNASLDFTSVACAPQAIIDSEDSYFSNTGIDPSSINATFNSTDHTATTVNGQVLSSCPMTALYVSDAAVAQTSAAAFQQILINDSNNNLVFVSLMNDDAVGFDGRTFDFQMIVPENTTGAINDYYFYVELD